MNSTMSVGQARKLVEQLKIEASFCRIKVRVAIQNKKMWQIGIRSVVILPAYKNILLYQPVRSRLICIRCDQRSGIRLMT